MEKIPTTRGTLFASSLPSIEDLIGCYFDIIWNLAAELKFQTDWEKEHAKIMLFGNIEDYSVPEDKLFFIFQLEQVINCLKHDGSVLVHCLGGHGRTGMVIACILNRLEGMSANMALKTAKQICFGPEMNDQIKFVKLICKENI